MIEVIGGVLTVVLLVVGGMGIGVAWMGIRHQDGLSVWRKEAHWERKIAHDNYVEIANMPKDIQTYALLTLAKTLEGTYELVEEAE